MHLMHMRETLDLRFVAIIKYNRIKSSIFHCLNKRAHACSVVIELDLCSLECERDVT